MRYKPLSLTTGLAQLFDARSAGRRAFIVKISAKALAIDAILLHLVAEDALGRAEKFCGASAVAARCLEGILNQILFVSADRRIKRQPRDRAAFGSRLQSRRQVVTMDDLAVADQHGALDAVLQFTYIARPVVSRQHINGWCRDAFDVFIVLARELFEKVIGKLQHV